MKINIRTETGKRFYLPAPMWIVKLGLRLGNAGIRIAGKHINEETKAQLQQIDFRELSRQFEELNKYKGLKIVEIKSKDGSEITITV